MNKKSGKREVLAIILAAALIATPMALSLPVEHAAAAGNSKLKVIAQPFNIEGIRTSIATINKDNTTYIGLRSLNNSLGLITNFDKAKQKIKVTGRDRVLEINLNNDSSSLNGQPLFGPSPFVQDNTTYLPLRYLLERLGYVISYETATKLIKVQAIQENNLKIHAEAIGADGDGKSLLVYYPVISGFSDTSVQQKINSFLKTEVDRNVAVGSKQMDQAIEENKKIKAENPDISVPQPSFNGYYTVTYNEQGRLSFYVDYHIYSGGAHGISARVPYTFDLATGNVLSLKEVTESNEHYVSIINNKIKAQIKAREMSLLTPFQTIENDRDYYLNRNGVVIFFSQYEYTSYAEGMPEFVIPYSEF